MNPNQNQPIDPEAQAEIIYRHAQAAQRELEAEAAKSAEAREARTLTRELETLTADIARMQKQPSAHRPQLREATARQSVIIGRLQQLNAAPADQGRQHYAPTVYDTHRQNYIGK